MKNKNVLVTGGAGFIGSNLVKHLIQEGNRVTILDNFMSGYRSNLDPFPTATIIEGDVRDQNVVELAMKGIEVVFHLAASVGNKRSIDHPITDAGINVLGTIQVLEAARKEGVRKIVTSSSAGIFGELKTMPIKEDHPIEPDSPYGCTKLCEEKLCLSYAKLYDIDAVALRYFNVYGPNQRFDAYGNVIPIFVFRMLNNESLLIYGDGEQTRDFVHVNDVVQANIKAADSQGVSGAFNIASGTRVTINRLVELISKANQNVVKIEYGPERAGDVRHSLADISLAYQTFGYFPQVSLENGIEEYVKWAQKLSVKV
ncbi:MAG: SDR family NAD(P)-dependent oxidoreductase [Bacteroidales bacterium]|nr:SDR family NAD(P)-dependent oxidoreductase [Bacteroidales bacterium]